MGTRSASRASRTTSKEKKDETQGLGLRGVGSVIAGSASSAGLRPGSAGSGEKVGERELTNGSSFKHVQMITVIDEVCFIMLYLHLFKCYGYGELQHLAERKTHLQVLTSYLKRTAKTELEKDGGRPQLSVSP